MVARSVITPRVVGKMISLLDYCYKLGVGAAHDLQDEGLTMEFLQRTSEAGVYGVLSDSPIYTTWQEWMLRLMAKARSTSWNGAMVQFFNRMGAFGANFLSAFMPVSFHLYRRGMEDYIKAPDAMDYNIFVGKARVWWTPKGVKNVNNREWVDTLQLISFDLERRDNAVWESQTPYQAKKIALKPNQYDMFRRCVGLALQPKYK